MMDNRIKKQITLNFSNAAAVYNEFAIVQKKVAMDLVDFIRNTCRLDNGAQKEIKILDVGCGTGFCIESIESSVPFPLVTGIDIASTMVDFCKTKWEHHEFIQADAEDFHPLAKYDLILSNFTMQWFQNILVFIKTCVDQWMAPQGTFAFAIPVEGSFHELITYTQTVNQRAIYLHPLPKADELIHYITKMDRVRVRHQTKEYVQWYPSPIESIRAIKAIGAFYQSNFRFSLPETRRIIRMYTQKEGFTITYKVLFLEVSLVSSPEESYRENSS